MDDNKKIWLCGGVLVFGAALAAFSVLLPGSEGALNHAVDLCMQFAGVA